MKRWEDRTRRDHVLGLVVDLVSDFLYYDRKEDENMPKDSIDRAVIAGEITVDEIVEAFRRHLTQGLLTEADLTR